MELARRERPDVVLMDVRTPNPDGIESTRHVCSAPVLAGVLVLILTTFDLDEHVHAALRAGGAGLPLKDTPPTEVHTAIGVVAAGETLLAPSVTRSPGRSGRGGRTGRRPIASRSAGGPRGTTAAP
ncbi:DNA-binding NarL/FixJ family response regulator [Streptomyces sp. V4I8]